MSPFLRKIIVKASLATVLSIAASLGLAVTIVPLLGGVVDGNAWLMCVLCPLLIAWPVSAWQFSQAERLRETRNEIARLHRELEEAHRNLSAAHAVTVEKARRDGMTGLLNRGSFLAAVREMMAGTRAGALLLVDADHFKQINDRFGHPVGDEALQGLAEAIAGALEAGHLAGRLGGEEFAVYLPGVATGEARRIAAKIIETVRRLRVAVSAEEAISLTVSIGGATQAGGVTLNELIAEADEQLYRAKMMGRNRAVFPPDGVVAA
ncbi:GGDEF domain-containing protein [Bosea minatitlanensis]|uniref:diguanylate cyclase n=1 Tax=Bosea minatitlanensis TaxID=128782 RepID=A0ABW0EXF7_9HYPH|nr:GGDEF domain-containing protein [Bosea minatitlanensis]MCT4492111.1 GGDEF domain-containing protein [Bosea minatitlanensis]